MENAGRAPKLLIVETKPIWPSSFISTFAFAFSYGSTFKVPRAAGISGPAAKGTVWLLPAPVPAVAQPPTIAPSAAAPKDA